MKNEKLWHHGMGCINYKLNFLEKFKNLFKLRDQKWSDDGPIKKKIFWTYLAIS